MLFGLATNRNEHAGKKELQASTPDYIHLKGKKGKKEAIVRTKAKKKGQKIHWK